MDGQSWPISVISQEKQQLLAALCTHFHSSHHVRQPGDQQPLEKPEVSRLDGLNRPSGLRDMQRPSLAFSITELTPLLAKKHFLIPISGHLC